MDREIKEKIEKGAVHTVFVIQILGRPPEHVKDSLKSLIDSFEKQKGVTMVNKIFHDPEPFESSLFSSFCEIEFVADNLSRLIGLVFDFMPGSVEIIAPEHLKLNVADANALVNDLSTKMHQYDAITKKEKIEKTILLRQLEKHLSEEQIKEALQIKDEKSDKESKELNPSEKKIRKPRKKKEKVEEKPLEETIEIKEEKPLEEKTEIKEESISESPAGI